MDIDPRLRPARVRRGDGSSLVLFEARRRYLEIFGRLFPEALAEYDETPPMTIRWVKRNGPFGSYDVQADLFQDWARKWGLCETRLRWSGPTPDGSRLLGDGESVTEYVAALWVFVMVRTPSGLVPQGTRPEGKDGLPLEDAYRCPPSRLEPPIYQWNPLSQNRKYIEGLILDDFENWLKRAMDETEAAAGGEKLRDLRYFDLHAEWAIRYQKGESLKQIADAHNSQGSGISTQAVSKAIDLILQFIALARRPPSKAGRPQAKSSTRRKRKTS